MWWVGFRDQAASCTAQCHRLESRLQKDFLHRLQGCSIAECVATFPAPVSGLPSYMTLNIARDSAKGQPSRELFLLHLFRIEQMEWASQRMDATLPSPPPPFHVHGLGMADWCSNAPQLWYNHFLWGRDEGMGGADRFTHYIDPRVVMPQLIKCLAPWAWVRVVRVQLR
mmetsp:Transcript_24606/g.44634  ORF Transcript_24606/g.44634 Transcript_24606/m.44634 type:complete len:169 (-) Transcript_24606:207-713(-)